MNIKGLFLGLACFVIGFLCGFGCYHIAVTSGVDMTSMIEDTKAYVKDIIYTVLPEEIQSDLEDIQE